VSAYIDGKYVGTVYRNDEERKLPLAVTGKSAVLDLLVENTGRINYGPLVGHDPKGLPLGVCLGYQQQIDFDIWNLELNDLSPIVYGEFLNLPQTPAFHRGTFEAEAGVDTFICTPGVKGVIWVNGFNLGRYWEIGPQKTLYIPGPLLKQGKNEIVVLELHQLSGDSAEFTDTPGL
jgi:beta-galactosidase